MEEKNGGCMLEAEEGFSGGQAVKSCLEEGIFSPSECLFLVLSVTPSSLAEKQNVGKCYVVI